MKLISVKPRGFCAGVASAIFKAKRVALENQGKPIYMLGHLVHNEYVSRDLSNIGITLLDDRQKKRTKIVEEDIPENSIIIFSAHGTEEETFAAAIKKNCLIVDTTCGYVVKTQDLIKEYLKKDYEIVFIGKKGHPETVSMLTINPKKIHLVETVEDVDRLHFNADIKLMLTTQTTISILDAQEITKSAISKWPSIEYIDEICNATTIRQEAILDLKGQNCDLLLVVGDKKSNNSAKLIDIGKSIGIPKCFLISSHNDIKDEWFQDVETIAVSSGASTPHYLTLETEEYLRGIMKKENYDYLEDLSDEVCKEKDNFDKNSEGGCGTGGCGCK